MPRSIRRRSTACFAHVPGLKVVAPSNPYDAKGLMITAIRDDNPVVYLFHKAMLGLPVLGYVDVSIDDHVPAESYTVPVRQGPHRARGHRPHDRRLFQTVQKAAIAADRLAAKGISAEVIDPRTLVPLDVEAIVASVQKTGRLLVVDEDYLQLRHDRRNQRADRRAPRRDQAQGADPSPWRGGRVDFLQPGAGKSVIPQVDHVIEAAERLVASRVL